MLFRRLYYQIKPWLPDRARLPMRRFWARRILKRTDGVWPILESAGRKPERWPGWPQGKQFAVVLTHDVEGRCGFGKCRRLMELELRHGFRSSFNLIPEGGDYTVTSEFREDFKRNGFEVGVHDLHHDGKLFASRRTFQRSAPRINHYLRDWRASGFRTGFMLRNLHWISELDLHYDASTFDTDPFEPQPDGTNTIFPFWVVRSPIGRPDDRVRPSGDVEDPYRQGFAELPYTLPQDSTLFLHLRHEDAGLWKQKVAWIAERGGMVLLNTHPDYKSFDEGSSPPNKYPAALYASFLKHLREVYGDCFWQALPCEVAEYIERHRAALSRRIVQDRPYRRICLVGSLFYDSDNRTMRYAESLEKRGDEVDVIAVRRPGESSETVLNGVKVYRIRERERNEKGKFGYLWRMVSFAVHSGWTLTRLHLRRRYDLIHVHSIPDFEVFSALVPKLMGSKILLDIYDVTPEFYLSKFNTTRDSLPYKWLIQVERVSCAFAHHVISANHLWQKLLTSRSVSEEGCTPFINYLDTELFRRRERLRRDDRFIVVYPGILNWHQGVDIAVRAFRIFKDAVPKAEFHIYGDGNQKQPLLELIRELKLDGSVLIKEIVPLREVPQIMADADMGVVAKRNDVFGGEAYSTKIMEYMSQGLPVVLSRTNIDNYYFNDSVVEFFEPENHADMAAKMLRVAREPRRREELAANAAAYVQQNRWEAKKADYLALVDRLIIGE